MRQCQTMIEGTRCQTVAKWRVRREGAPELVCCHQCRQLWAARSDGTVLIDPLEDESESAHPFVGIGIVVVGIIIFLLIQFIDAVFPGR